MAELQAIFLDDKKGAQAGWRKPLVQGQTIRLGRLPNLSDWWINDENISGFHATITWDGSKLAIQLRDPPPLNPMWYNRKKVEDKIQIICGESFIIGSTKFTVLDENDLASEPSHDQTVRFVETSLSKSDWHFDNSAAFFKAIERLPSAIALNTDEQQLFRNMADVLSDALPWANTVAVVALVPDSGEGDLKVAIHYHKQKTSARSNGQKTPIPTSKADMFTPSRKLANKAIRMLRKSTRHVWENENSRDSELTVNPQLRMGKPWAICTPIGDDTQFGLYVDGCLAEHLKAITNRTEEQELNDYQKIIDLIASLIHASRVAIEKDHQLDLCKRFLPRRLWLDMDEKKIMKLLEPRMVEATVLFCDLRGSCQIAEEGEQNLQQTWDNLSEILDDMTRSISAEDGIVAGIQGDGVVGFWGWPEAGPHQQSKTDNIERAVKVALEIRDRFTQGAYAPQFRCGIGIAHGKAIAGRLGTHDLAKVDVYGTVVNLASRLESITKPLGVSIIIDEAVATALNSIDPQRRRWRTRRLARVRPEGMTRPNLISELLPHENYPGKNLPESVRRNWERVVDSFLSKDWNAAKASLDFLPAGDELANFLREYMKKSDYVAPENWDGVITMRK